METKNNPLFKEVNIKIQLGILINVLSGMAKIQSQFEQESGSAAKAQAVACDVLIHALMHAMASSDDLTDEELKQALDETQKNLKALNDEYRQREFLNRARPKGSA